MGETWDGRLELESECEPPNESQDKHQIRKQTGGVVDDSQRTPQKVLQRVEGEFD